MPESRRTLLKTGVGLMGSCYAAAVGYPVYRYLATPAVRARAQGLVTTVSIPQKDLPGPGSATMFLFGARPSLLIHYDDGHYASFDAVCTLMGCTVRFESQNKRIFCPCHGGTYDMNTGEVVSGPPPRALKVYRVEVADGNVVVSRA
jgi:cytochrome b6-f complex iron-sulfur subunit